jgi:CheY-like chemotaxis protein/predicted regulator of Ras-like GTPase activity (Roadblock/LC7/MglB family)
MVEPRKILIVDDDENVRRLMHDGLQRIGQHWDISTADNGEDALELVQRTTFDLLITDLRMPGIHGLELINQVREISPKTEVVLITAYGSEDVEEEASRLSVHSYLTKPVPIPTIRRIVREALEQTSKAREAAPEPLEQETEDEVLKHVSVLRTYTEARCVLLIDKSGHLLNYAGMTDDLDVHALAALVAANVAAMSEIARLLESQAAFKSFFHENDEFNIYSYMVGEEHIVIVVSSPEVKTGLVWFYTRQAAEDLEEVLAQVEDEGAFELDVDALSASLDSVLGMEFDEADDREASADVESLDANRPESPRKEKRTAAPQLLSWDEAVSRGLIGNNVIEDTH